MSIFNKKPYLAAISGGPDSIALLHMYRRHIRIVAVVKYNKRQDCQCDVDCVVKLCDKYKIKYEILDVTSDVYKQYNFENNFQNKARLIRYDFFEKIAKENNLNKILVAHHLDDFLETAYLDFVKNSQKTFYGIREKSFYKDIEINRPLLRRYRKATLERYCQDFKLDYAIDSSNLEDLYERNQVRKIIQSMPSSEVWDLLRKTYKHNKENSKKEKIINEIFYEWEHKMFDVEYFLNIDCDLQNNLIFKFLESKNYFRPNINKIISIINFINSKKYSKSFRISNDQYLRIIDHKLVLEKNKNGN